MDSVLEAVGLEKVFDAPGGELCVLRGVSLGLEPGEIVSVLGPSGAGKSTLLHVLGALERPTSGKVLYDGEDVYGFPPAERARFRGAAIGFVFQFHHLLPELTALENVMLPALLARAGAREARSRAQKLLTEVGLVERAEHRPAELSGGEQQRVAVARALVNRPSIVLADEPTGNLDRTTGATLLSLLWRLNRERGTSFLVVTHDEELALRADRCLYLVDGRLGS